MVKRTYHKLLFISGTNFLRGGYGGEQHLASSLHRRGIAIRMMAWVPNISNDEIKSLPYTIVRLPGALMKIPRLRGALYRIFILIEGLRYSPVIMVSERTYFREAVWLRRARPQARLIQFCQEYATPEEYPSALGIKYYARHAGIPDLVIDVEKNRAKLRKNRFNLAHNPLVLPNTIPMSEIPPKAPRGTLNIYAGGNLPENVPIVLYLGGIHSMPAMKRLVDAFTLLPNEFFFLAFCHGSTKNINELRHYLNERLGPKKGKVCDALPRSKILSAAWEASIAVVYYPEDVEPTMNYRYCAPSKIFEYMALGLPILSSGNPPLRMIVEGESIGICTKRDTLEDLTVAIKSLLENEKYRRDISKRGSVLFNEKYCYEKMCDPVVNQIVYYIQHWQTGLPCK